MEITATPIPSWLMLDQIVSPELVAEMAAMAQEALALAEQVTALSKQVVRMLTDYDAAQAASGVTEVDDLPEYIDKLTGWDRIEAALSIIDGACEAARGGCVTEMHYDRCATAFGIETLRGIEQLRQTQVDLRAGDGS